MINYCTVCGGELKLPVSEKKEQHQCPTCGVIMTTFIDLGHQNYLYHPNTDFGGTQYVYF